MIVEAFEYEMTTTISLGALAKQSHIYLGRILQRVMEGWQ